MRKWQVCAGVFSLVLGSWLAVGPEVGTAQAAGIDGMVLTGGLNNLMPAVPLVGVTTSSYQLAATCGVDSGVPSFVDADTSGTEPQTGTCGSLSGSGMYTNAVCGTGIAQGSATLFEPNGEKVALGPYVIVFVGGVGAVAMLGYGDDGAAVGGGGGVALMVPTSLAGCGTLTNIGLVLVLGAVHT